jgi:positive regulator of sigma E activity
LPARGECLSVGAKVVSAEDGAVELALAEAGSCRGCAGACFWHSRRVSHQRFRSEWPLQTGDEVRVSLPARWVLRASLLLHGLPLAALLAGAVLGSWVTHADWGCLLGALAGLALVLSSAPRLRARLERAAFAEVEIIPGGPGGAAATAAAVAIKRGQRPRVA